jgi:acetyltransferase-like isoleucine patch superfamily enzyme
VIDAKFREIAENALLKNVEINAESVTIKSNAKLTNVKVKAKCFFVGHDTKISDSVIMTSGDAIIGDFVQIKEGSALNAFKGIRVGSSTLVDRGVVVAGVQSEKSYFEIGSRCVILHHTYINTTREVIVGSNVGIGGFCMIFTHGVWQNALKGYPYQFGKVEIKDDAWLPWHVFVMPGVTIGKGSTIAGASVVTRNIPDYSLAAGVPAKVIRGANYPKALSLDEKDSLTRQILEDFRGYFEGFIGDKSIALLETPSRAIILKSDIGNLLYVKQVGKRVLDDPKLKALNDLDIVSFTVPSAIRSRYMWIELESETRSSQLNKLALEFVAFIRRYGIRLITC